MPSDDVRRVLWLSGLIHPLQLARTLLDKNDEGDDEQDWKPKNLVSKEKHGNSHARTNDDCANDASDESHWD